MNTKDRILRQGLQLFNERGFGSVSLQDIANELQVGRRNIAYHFHTKDDLLEALTEEMWQKMELERQKRRDFPSFQNLDNEVRMYYQFQRDYAFIFNDLHVIRHPILEERFRSFCLETIRDNEAAIAFAIRLGNMNPEPIAGVYHNLSLSIWVLALFWIPQQRIRNVNDEEEVIKVIWSLILPYFTEKGIESFQAFFGEEFYRGLGRPFDVRLNHAFF